ncbi:MAG: hypothetical protein HY606_12525, partial [Planctomycetes bacterium]|nr:hypothetical protein [Planctomycetota bacterium]
DLKIFKIIIEKIINIKNSTGIIIPLPVNSEVLHKIIMDDVVEHGKYVQLEMDFARTEALNAAKYLFGKGFNEFVASAKITRQVFRHEDAPVDDIREIFSSCDKTLGTPEELRLFLKRAFIRSGCSINEFKANCYKIDGLQTDLKEAALVKSDSYKFTTLSPSPNALPYVGRLHPFVSHLAEQIFEHSVSSDLKSRGSRMSAIAVKGIEEPVAFFLLRTRYLLKGEKDDIVEEVIVASVTKSKFELNSSLTGLGQESSKRLEDSDKRKWLSDASSWFNKHKDHIKIELLNRSKDYLNGYNKIRKLLKQSGAEGILLGDPPYDKLGIIVLVPA